MDEVGLLGAKGGGVSLAGEAANQLTCSMPVHLVCQLLWPGIPKKRTSHSLPPSAMAIALPIFATSIPIGPPYICYDTSSFGEVRLAPPAV